MPFDRIVEVAEGITKCLGRVLTRTPRDQISIGNSEEEPSSVGVTPLVMLDGDVELGQVSGQSRQPPLEYADLSLDDMPNLLGINTQIVVPELHASLPVCRTRRIPSFTLASSACPKSPFQDSTRQRGRLVLALDVLSSTLRSRTLRCVEDRRYYDLKGGHNEHHELVPSA